MKRCTALMKRIAAARGRVAASLAAMSLAVSLALSLTALPAAADVSGVTVSPSAATVSTAAPTAVSLTWTVNVVNPDRFPVTFSLASPTGQARIGGSTVASFGGALQRTVTLPGFASRSVIFTETVPVSRALARRLGESGAVLLQRRFSDNGGTAVAAARLRPAGAGLEGFVLQRLELRFDDNTQYRIVQKGDALRARLDIAHLGAGILRGRWELADPGSTALGNPRFRVIAEVRRDLFAAGRAVVDSPLLPTRLSGVHIVRFTPDDSAVAPVEIRYVVQGDKTDGTIRLIAPEDGAPVSPATLFAWQPHPRAVRQRLEIFAAGAGPVGVRTGDRIAGVEIGPRIGGLRLESHTFDRLGDAGPLYWQIVAIGEDGSIVGQSSRRRLVVGAPSPLAPSGRAQP